MKFHNFKPYVKYGLFLMLTINLVGTAYADTDQLVYYDWSEDTENTIIDNSGHGNDGTNNGSTTFILPTGQIARHFNGQNKITIPDNEQLEFTDPHITFGVFFRYDCSNPTNCTYLVSKGNNTCSISIDHTNSTMAYEIYADGHAISGYGESQIEPDEDYEAIVTYDGSHAQLYINGIASGKGVDYTAAALGSSYDTNSWTIGSSPDTMYGLNGEIYTFYVYDRTLSSSEILDLYVNDIHSIRDSNKPGGIALSWDDTGHIDTCYKYLSIFQQYNATCTMNVNKISSREIPAQTLANELNALHSAGWEIAAHGYNHTNSRLFLINNTPTEWLNQEIFPNIVEITRYGYPVYSLAYPYSDRNTASDTILAPYFRTLRTGVPSIINNNVNQTPLAYYDWDDAQLLYGVEIDDSRNVSLQSIESGIDYAITTGNVLVLYGHTITPNVTGPYQTSTSRLDSILNYTSQNGGAFYHMGDLGNSTWVRPARFSNVTANYTVSRNTLLVGENVTFVDYSINQNAELLDFGDGSPASSTANVTHTYTTPRTYTANLTVTNEVSSHSMLQTITVIEPTAPVASFTSNCTTGFPPLNVTFTDTSTGLPTSWSWDFGDGNISISQNTTHAYSAAGNYTVRLNVTNEYGSNFIQKVDYITVLEPPSANFYSNVTSGNIPLTVQFCDTSTGSPASWNWNFGDGYTSTEQNPVHTYCSAGTFNVDLIVSYADRNSSKTATITVLQESSSNGGSSGGSSHKSGSSSGGGGAGGSPEPAKNVKVKELSQTFITNGNPIKFDFTKNATCVVSVSFDAKKTVGKTTTIVEMLKNKSTLTPDAPEGEVYGYLNIWVGNSGYATEKNIENATVCFKVEKPWIQDKDIDQTSIILNRYSDKKWNGLPTTLLREDDKYLYFTAETPGFSPFAITAEENVIEILPEPDTQGSEQNESTQSEIEEKPEQTGNTSMSGKENVSMPGFEIIYCISGLLGVFRYKRR
jgi:PGF-pre-PGF domain-containing protein